MKNDESDTINLMNFSTKCECALINRFELQSWPSQANRPGRGVFGMETPLYYVVAYTLYGGISYSLWHFDCARLDWWQSSIEFNTFGFISVVYFCCYCYGSGNLLISLLVFIVIVSIAISICAFLFLSCCAGKVFALLSSISILIVTFAPISGCQRGGGGETRMWKLWLFGNDDIRVAPSNFRHDLLASLFSQHCDINLVREREKETLKLINII